MDRITKIILLRAGIYILKMAFSRAANVVEHVADRSDNADITTNVSNYAKGSAGEETDARIKATTWQGKGSVKLVEIPKPRVIDAGDVIVKITGSTICGSDLHLYHGVIPQMQKGDVLGHEFCGIVETVGPEAKKWKAGDRVVASFVIACGNCPSCQRQKTSQCEKTNDDALESMLYGNRTSGFFGYSHLTGGFAGGQAEYVRVPHGDMNLLGLPDDVPDEKGLYLSDVLSTSWHCVVDTGIHKDDVVAVWGAGPIGQMVVDFAFYHGASRVILIDGGNASWRLDYVKSKIPQTETIDFTKLPKDESITSQLKKMVHNGPDVALDCSSGEYAKGWGHYFETLFGVETDTSEMLNEMITALQPFGRIGVTGVYAGYTNHFNIGALMQTGIRLIGNGQAPVHIYWEHLLDLVRKNEIKPLRMLTHRILIDDMEKLYSMFEKRENGIQKVFVETKFSATPCPGSPELVRL